MRRVPASATVFGTSAAVLVVEIIAGRLMAPYVGISLETFTGIIGTMLAGIAAGAAVGGWMTDRWDPRRMVGPAVVAGGALCWLSLPILSILGPLVGSGPVAIVTLTGATFFLPVAVLSAVSPMVAASTSTASTTPDRWSERCRRRAPSGPWSGPSSPASSSSSPCPRGWSSCWWGRCSSWSERRCGGA